MANPTDGPYSRAPELEAGEVERDAVVRIADEIVIDLMAKACGVDFAEALRSGGLESFDLEGVTIPLATKKLLIRTKDTVRPSDAMDVEYLRLRLAEEKSAG